MSGKRRRFWPKLTRRTQIILLSVALVLICARLAAPFVIRDFVDRRLDQIEGFNGHVGAVRLNLFRGAYQAIDLRLVKTNAEVPVPFITIPKMDLSVDWNQLLRGAVEGEVVLERPSVNFVNGPTERQKQTGVDRGWKDALQDLFPFTINRFEVNNGVVRFADPYREPPVDMFVTNLFATATNLSNVREKAARLPAGLVGRGVTTGAGNLELELHMNPLADAPTFELLASITNMNLTALNDFMRSYGNFDANRGRFSVFLEVAANGGDYRGYVKPFFVNLDVFEWEQERKDNALRAFWEAIVAGVSEIFENKPADQLATTVPISGEFETGTNVDLWTTIAGILRNAFIRALLPKLHPPNVTLPEDKSRTRAEE